MYEQLHDSKGTKSRSDGLFIGGMIDFWFRIGTGWNEVPAIPIYSINPFILHKHFPTIRDLIISFFDSSNEDYKETTIWFWLELHKKKQLKAKKLLIVLE